MSPLQGAKPFPTWILEGPVASLICHVANKLSRSRGFGPSDQPDIEQELLVHLWRNAHKYDAARSKATTFAKRVIQNKAASMARNAVAKKRKSPGTLASLNKPVFQDGDTVELCDTLEFAVGRRHTCQRVSSETEQSVLRLDVAEANSTLPPVVRVLAALISHVPLFAAGQALGISRRQTARYMLALKAAYEARGLKI